MYMLDTNILIRAIRHPEDPVSSRIAEHIGGQICISAVTYAELVYGVKRSANAVRNMQAVQRMLSGIYILPFVMAYLAAVGRPIGDRDALIAAHARSLSVTLVTHNMGEFSRVPGLKAEDWVNT